MAGKKKIATYGLHYSDYAKQRNLFALRNNADIEIVAEIAYDAAEPEIFYKRMTAEEALSVAPDMVIVCSGTVEEARQKLPEFINIEDISILTGPHYEKIKEGQLEILKDIVGAADEQISDRAWLGGKLNEYGFYPFFKLAKEPQPGVTWSTRGILQVPDEFLDLCMSISKLKVEDAIEVGVARGASSYILAALLYRNNPDLEYHMVDIVDDLNEYDRVHEIIPVLRKAIPNTSDDFKGRAFDFCFIDADHSYDGMMNDWNNVGQYAKKLTVFHDIFGHEYDSLNGGTVRGWKEIKEACAKEEVAEISRYYDRWMGIGVVDRRGTAD